MGQNTPHARNENICFSTLQISQELFCFSWNIDYNAQNCGCIQMEC